MKERIVDGRCKECFELNPSEIYCDTSPSGYHKIEPYGVERFARTWDESKHPRHQKGSGDEGGEFAPKGGGDATRPATPEKEAGSIRPKVGKGSHMDADVAALASGQLKDWKDLGKYKPEDFELRTVPLDKVTPSQTGEDYINNSSKELANHIGKFGASGRMEDYRPILVDKNYRIIDGNHRHAARKLAGIKYIPVIVAKKHDETKDG